MKLRSCAIAVLFAMLPMAAVVPLTAQGVNSSVQGAVTDSSGAAIPGSDVQLINTRTGVVLKTQSDGAGNYVFPAVAPGVYTLQVVKSGFAEFKLTEFSVIVGQHATENANMSVASQSQSVTVEANGLANLLETQSNDLGNVIGPQSVAQLPLNGRNFLQLGLLSGATQSNQGAATSATGQTGHPWVSINIAGNEPDFTMYLIDGIQTIGTRAGNTSLNLSTDAIDQFEVHYGFFMPDMGTNPGIVDVVSKSGTNQIHGEAYEYVRNNQMEARDYFSQTAPGPYHQNQFGAAVGGPILKDKLFYFGNYEGYRQISSAFRSAFTPTQAMFGGDFSAAGLPAIYDPQSYNPAHRPADAVHQQQDSFHADQQHHHRPAGVLPSRIQHHRQQQHKRQPRDDPRFRPDHGARRLQPEREEPVLRARFLAELAGHAAGIVPEPGNCVPAKYGIRGAGMDKHAQPHQSELATRWSGARFGVRPGPLGFGTSDQAWHHRHGRCGWSPGHQYFWLCRLRHFDRPAGRHRRHVPNSRRIHLVARQSSIQDSAATWCTRAACSPAPMPMRAASSTSTTYSRHKPA